jgi:imidazolonepropionase-like amidohydrolase
MNHARSLLLRLGVALVLTLFGSPGLAGPPQVYQAARIWTGEGPPIADGILIVRDGKILAVGPRAGTAVPEDAEVHDLGRAVVIPGLVIAETTLGEGGRDDEHALTPEFRAIDGFDFYADYRAALAGGVTTVQIAPGSHRLLPGQGAVVKLAGDDPQTRTLRERESLRILLGEAFKNPPRIYEPPVAAVSVERPLRPTRQQLAASLGSAVAGLRATLRAALEYSQPIVGKRGLSPSPQGDSPLFPGRSDKDPLLGTLAEYLKNGGVFRVTAPGSADLRAALALAGEFHLRLLLVDPSSLEPFRDQLRAWRELVAGVILNAEVRPGALADLSIPDKENPKRRLPGENARDLLAAGLKVAIRPASDSDLGDTLFVAGLFTAGGPSAQEVLRMLTAYPAELLGVADRVGSLAAGKDADFVVLNGEPFATHTRVEAVYVNGQPAYTAKTASRATVIQASRIYTGTGETIQQGALLVEGSTIRGLGHDVSAPADAVVRRYDRAVIVPGFLDLATGLGLGGPLNTPVSLQTNLGDRLISDDPAVAVARQGGVTTVLLASSNPAASPVVAFKLGDRPRVLQEPVAIHFGITGNLTAQATSLRSTLQSAQAYAESWTRYETAYAEYEKKKQEYDAAKAKSAPAAKSPSEGEKVKASGDGAKSDEKKTDPPPKKDAAKAPSPYPLPLPDGGEGRVRGTPAEPKPPDKPRLNENLEPYRPLFAGQIPALVEARRADAIQLAVQIFRDEFKLRTILSGADDAFRLADLLLAKQVAVAIGPELVRTVDREPINLAQVLANRGVPFGFQSKATTGVKMLPLVVQYAVRRGLSTDDALAGLTAGPAKFLALDKRVGTLAVGKDADLVVLSGPPFELSTRVLAVMIDGQWVYHVEDNR